MKLKTLLATLFVSQLVAMETQSSQIIGDGVHGTLNVLNSALTIVRETLANDYLCGSLVIQVPHDWKIVNVRVNYGSIQNQFQFSQDPDDSDLYFPNDFGGNLLEIRQSTGILISSRLYPLNYPIDIDLKLAQKGQFNEVSYRVTKRVCNFLQVGGVEVTHTDGNPVHYNIINPVQDDTTWIIHRLNSCYFTPAYLLIPATFSG